MSANFYIPEPRPFLTPRVGRWVTHRENDGKALITSIKQDHYEVLWGGLRKGAIMKKHITNYRCEQS